MAKIRSRLLVVDASIASAAGDVSTHPTSRRCRDFLLAIREICHEIVMTAPIQQEWDKHQSRFARTWRLSMLAKKKLKILESHAQRSLEQRFSRVVIDPFVHAIMEKDRCLVEAALLSEKRIASLDDSVRTHFRKLSRQLAGIEVDLLGQSRRDRRRSMRLASCGSADRTVSNSRVLGASAGGMTVHLPARGTVRDLVEHCDLKGTPSISTWAWTRAS